MNVSVKTPFSCCFFEMTISTKNVALGYLFFQSYCTPRPNVMANLLMPITMMKFQILF